MVYNMSESLETLWILIKVIGFSVLCVLAVIIPLDILCDYLREEKSIPITWLDVIIIMGSIISLTKTAMDFRTGKIREYSVANKKLSNTAFYQLSGVFAVFGFIAIASGMIEPLSYYAASGRYKGFESYGYSSIILGIVFLSYIYIFYVIRRKFSVLGSSCP